MIVDGKRLISINDALLVDGVERLSKFLENKKVEIAKLYQVDLNDLNIMFLLLQNGHAKVQEIAKHINVTSGAATYIINGLIKRNIVQVGQNLTDKRVKFIELTRPGNKKAKHMASEYCEHVTGTLSVISKLDKSVIANSIDSATKQFSKTVK